jgi:RNA polymerase sigma factor for flagellar operon FliA
MSQTAEAPALAPLTKEQQALVTDAMHFMEVIAAKVGQQWTDRLSSDEIRAAAAAALVEAARTYDPSRGVPFTTYAYHRIQWAILDLAREELRFNGPYIALGMYRTASEYLADEPDVPKDDAANSMRDWRRRSANLGGGIAAAMFAGIAADVLNTQDGTEEAFARRQANERVVAALQDVRGHLPDRERVVLDLHYGQGMRLEDVAAQMEVAYSTVKRIHAALLIHMQDMLRKRGVSAFEDTGLTG